MPMYDYRCRRCGSLFEELVSSSSVPDKEIPCPQCGAHEAERQLSAPAVAVKGGTYTPTTATRPPCGAPPGFS